jgi:osmoprotectant transport system ATP-binding protein
LGDIAIRLANVTKTFAGTTTPAVGDLTLDVTAGEIVMLVGPSGCGKTTTLKMINRLIEPTSGTITVNGTDVASVPAPQLRRGIGYVIQQVGLFPHRTIAGNIAVVPELVGWDKDRIRDRIDELLDLVRLDPAMAGRYPHELSGGQRQRVGVARALAADPPVLLMDEPFGAVDPLVRADLQDQLIALQDRLHKTIVFVTHDIDEAIRLGDRVAILNVGGRLEQYATPAEILRSPANEFVEAFLGSERGLRRLALVPVGDLDIGTGPVVEIGQGRGEAEAVMRREGVDWVGVVDGERILGWVWGHEVPERMVDAAPQPFMVTVQAASSLRQALDAIVVSRNNVAVVCAGDRFIGMLTVEQLSRELAR